MSENTKSMEKVHKPARPMKVLVDKEGCSWICDDGVDPEGNLEDQGCWRCSEVPFTRND